MKNHRFPWLRNRTTDNRKCEKACNIKEKRTIEMFKVRSEGRPPCAPVQQALISLTQEINSTAFQSVLGRCFAGFIEVFGVLSVPGLCCA